MSGPRWWLAPVAVAALVTGTVVFAADDQPVLEHATMLAGDGPWQVAARLCPHAPDAMFADISAANPWWPDVVLKPGTVLHYHPDACPEEPPPSTSPPSSTAPETSSPATSSVPSSTSTTTPPTTSSTTSSSVAPTTTAPPATTTTIPPTSGTFRADFATASDFYDRFDFGLSGVHPSVDPNYNQDWEGDHNLACDGALTSRDVHLGQAPDISELFWHCAPGGADNGHMMTSLHPLGYAYLWFSPAQYFTDVERVCWDQNTTMLGGRKWTQVSISTRAEVERVIADAGKPSGPGLDLGFSHPGFQTPGGPTTGVIPTDQTVAVWVLASFMHLYTGNTALGDGASFSKHEDVATRFTLCMIDNGNDTITLTQEQPGGGLWSDTLGGSFPDGEVRVAFTDANYDPPKDGEYDASQNTWHWDSILVESG